MKFLFRIFSLQIVLALFLFLNHSPSSFSGISTDTKKNDNQEIDFDSDDINLVEEIQKRSSFGVSEGCCGVGIWPVSTSLEEVELEFINWSKEESRSIEELIKDSYDQYWDSDLGGYFKQLFRIPYSLSDLDEMFERKEISYLTKHILRIKNHGGWGVYRYLKPFAGAKPWSDSFTEEQWINVAKIAAVSAITYDVPWYQRVLNRGIDSLVVIYLNSPYETAKIEALKALKLLGITSQSKYRNHLRKLRKAYFDAKTPENIRALIGNIPVWKKERFLRREIGKRGTDVWIIKKPVKLIFGDEGLESNQKRIGSEKGWGWFGFFSRICGKG